MTQLPPLRFAVGSFETWLQLHRAAREMERRGLSPDRIDCVAQRRVFEATSPSDLYGASPAIVDLMFPDTRYAIACTSGVLAESLRERLRIGAKTFQEALSHWLLPRHAGHFQSVVDAGRILTWVRLNNPCDERNAYEVLLTTSSSSVGVHDLVGPPQNRLL